MCAAASAFICTASRSDPASAAPWAASLREVCDSKGRLPLMRRNIPGPGPPWARSSRAHDPNRHAPTRCLPAPSCRRQAESRAHPVRGGNATPHRPNRAQAQRGQLPGATWQPQGRPAKSRSTRPRHTPQPTWQRSPAPVSCRHANGQHGVAVEHARIVGTYDCAPHRGRPPPDTLRIGQHEVRKRALSRTSGYQSSRASRAAAKYPTTLRVAIAFSPWDYR